jgi:hypothetical protein
MRFLVDRSKDKIVPVLNCTPRHEDVCGSGGIAHTLTSALGGGEWSSSRPGQGNTSLFTINRDGAA